jgi:hypothetical protein
VTIRRRTGIVVGLAVSSLLAGGVTAWGSTYSASDDSKSQSDREKRYKEVIQKKDPTPKEVKEIAGAPESVTRAKDGSLAVMYYAPTVDYHEGPAAEAWQLISPSGKVVAESARHADSQSQASLSKAGDGFLYVGDTGAVEDSFFLDTSGKKHSLKESKEETPSKAGDASFPLGGGYLYRPSTGTVAPVAGPPSDAEDVMIDDQGTTWAVTKAGGDQQANSIDWWPGGKHQSKQLPQGGHFFNVSANNGDTTVAPYTQDGSDGVAGLLVTTDRGKSWRTIKPSSDLPLNKMDPTNPSLDLSVLDDGRILLSEVGKSAWVADDGDNNSFHEVKKPLTFATYQGEGKSLYGFADSVKPSYDLVEGEGLYKSEDGGKWSEVDLGQ